MAAAVRARCAELSAKRDVLFAERASASPGAISRIDARLNEIGNEIARARGAPWQCCRNLAAAHPLGSRRCEGGRSCHVLGAPPFAKLHRASISAIAACHSARFCGGPSSHCANVSNHESGRCSKLKLHGRRSASVSERHDAEIGARLFERVRTAQATSAGENRVLINAQIAAGSKRRADRAGLNPELLPTFAAAVNGR